MHKIGILSQKQSFSGVLNVSYVINKMYTNKKFQKFLRYPIKLKRSGILIFQTSKGNENWFEKSDSSRSRGRNKILLQRFQD